MGKTGLPASWPLKSSCSDARSAGTLQLFLLCAWELSDWHKHAQLACLLRLLSDSWQWDTLRRHAAVLLASQQPETRASQV